MLSSDINYLDFRQFPHMEVIGITSKEKVIAFNQGLKERILGLRSVELDNIISHCDHRISLIRLCLADEQLTNLMRETLPKFATDQGRIAIDVEFRKREFPGRTYIEEYEKYVVAKMLVACKRNSKFGPKTAGRYLDMKDSINDNDGESYFEFYVDDPEAVAWSMEQPIVYLLCMDLLCGGNGAGSSFANAANAGPISSRSMQNIID